jgi:hypothetical protein
MGFSEASHNGGLGIALVASLLLLGSGWFLRLEKVRKRVERIGSGDMNSRPDLN